MAYYYGAGAYPGYYSPETEYKNNGTIRPGILFLAWVEGPYPLPVTPHGLQRVVTVLQRDADRHARMNCVPKLLVLVSTGYKYWQRSCIG